MEIASGPSVSGLVHIPSKDCSLCVLGELLSQNIEETTDSFEEHLEWDVILIASTRCEGGAAWSNNSAPPLDPACVVCKGSRGVRRTLSILYNLKIYV